MKKLKKILDELEIDVDPKMKRQTICFPKTNG
jgi:hypothetical protein